MTRPSPGPPGSWSLYLHVPFCIRKCPYCDFFSVTDRSLMPAYVDGVCKEIRMWSEMNPLRLQAPLQSLYLGGGTPSVLSLSGTARILETACQSFTMARDAEITMEVNPGTVNRNYLSDLRHLGINRLSIGAQSFDAAKLAFLSRIHSGNQVFEALSGAVQAGFSNVGLDLMYALPGESTEVWQADLDTAIQLQVPHLSCYMLTPEPGTPLYEQYQTGRFSFPDPERRSELFVHTSRVLENAGYAHYEVSNFAKDRQFRSVHNTRYWDRKAYIGIGPSAHSFLPRRPEIRNSRRLNQDRMPSFIHAGGPGRFWNPSDIRAWLNHLAAGRLPWEDYEMLTPDQEKIERIMLGLRTDKGMGIHGLDPGTLALMAQLAEQGSGTFFNAGSEGAGNQRFRLTRSGLMCLDGIVDALVPGLMS